MRAPLLILPLLAFTAACGAIPDARAPQKAVVSRSTPDLFAPARDAPMSGAASTSRAAFTPLPDQYYGAGCSTLARSGFPA
ncbi:MAG: hypothetical protein R3E03_00930 [Novosphingobium sp.]